MIQCRLQLALHYAQHIKSLHSIPWFWEVVASVQKVRNISKHNNELIAFPKLIRIGTDIVSFILPIYFADGAEMKIPVFKLKKKDEDKFLTADVIDGSVQILSDTGDNKQKWYVKNR